MRSLRIVLTLVFGLAMVGPETHACPVHSASSAPSHHQSNHQPAKGHCTCPQACCPAGASVTLPTPVASWTVVPLRLIVVDAPAVRPLLLPARKHILPLALAPPRL